MSQESQSSECWMKLGEAAFALGVSEITLRRKVKCGRLPHEFREGKYYVLVQRDSQTGNYCEQSPAPALNYADRARRNNPLPRAQVNEDPLRVQQQAEGNNLRVRHLQSQLEEKEIAIRALRRTVEDQQTLIGLLEHAIAGAADRREAQRSARAGARAQQVKRAPGASSPG